MSPTVTRKTPYGSWGPEEIAKAFSRRCGLTTGEVAKMVGVAPRTVSQWVDKRWLKASWLPHSNDRRIEPKELYMFLLEHKTTIPPELVAHLNERVLCFGLADEDITPADSFVCENQVELGLFIAAGGFRAVLIGDCDGTAALLAALLAAETHLPAARRVVVLSEGTQFDPGSVRCEIFHRPLNWNRVLAAVAGEAGISVVDRTKE